MQENDALFKRVIPMYFFIPISEKNVNNLKHNNHHGNQDFIWSTVRQTRWLLWRNFKDGTRDPTAMRLLFFQTLVIKSNRSINI